jgi:molybdate transport system permease protein
MFELSSSDYDAILLSLKVSTTATLLALPMGFAVAYALTYLRFRGKIFCEVVVNLPLTLPPVVVGYGLLVLLGNRGWMAPVLKFLGWRILFSWKAAVIASMVIGFPLLVRPIRTAMESIDEKLLQASRSLGANWFDMVLSVIVPLSLRGILAGSSLMFARSLGEFGATVIVAGNIPGVTQTIPLAIYDYAGSPGGESVAAALCLVSVVISLVFLVFHESLIRRAAREDRP